MVSDRCVFRKGELWVLLYVDDVIIIVKDIDTVQDTKNRLSALLDMKDMEELSTFLGVMFSKDSEGGRLSQEHYVKTLLSQYGMDQCKPVSTPTCGYGELEDHGENIDQRKYQELVGSLLFLSTRTRPDIAVAVNLLSRHCANPKAADMKAAKRVLRYLKGTLNFFLRLKKGNSTLAAYCDADWAGDRVDRKSTSGALFQVGGTSVYWFAAKQKKKFLSTLQTTPLSLAPDTFLSHQHPQCLI